MSFFRFIRQGRSAFARGFATQCITSSRQPAVNEKAQSWGSGAAAAAAIWGATMFSASCYSSSPSVCEESGRRTLYPPIEPNSSNLMKVSDLHCVHYQEYGNPRGKPVLFVHGGPGGGTDSKVYYNYAKYEYY